MRQLNDPGPDAQAAILPALTLLLAEDRNLRVAFANAARGLGIEVVVASSVEFAHELLQQRSFPLIVVDVSVGGGDVIDVVERLAGQDRASAFVLMSAEAAAEVHYKGLAGGAIAARLVSPWSASELRSTLERANALHLSRSRPSAAPLGWSVLLVDDSPEASERLKEQLRELPGLSLVHVTRLQDALRALHHTDFDSIITELSLPDACGMDAVLRLHASAPASAILVTSAVDDEALALQVVQLGAQDFLPKGRSDARSVLRALRFARERKRSELRLRRLAHYDPLTGLANRPSFGESMVQAVARCDRQNRRFALLMIDLDGFKDVNDSLGHDAGDRVLYEVGVRLRCVFREYDIVARFGGDEFAVLLNDVQSRDELRPIVERLLYCLSAPIALGETSAVVCGSVGVALYPEAGTTPDRLLKSADFAMYAAKRAGQNRYCFSDGPAQSSTPPLGSAPPSPRISGALGLKPARLPSEFRASGVRAHGRDTERECADWESSPTAAMPPRP